MTVGAAGLTVERRAGIRRRLDGKGLVFSVPCGIPAYAGMTVGAAAMMMGDGGKDDRAAESNMDRQDFGI